MADDPQAIQPAAFEPLTGAPKTEASRFSLTRAALYVAVSIFALALFFLLTARSLEITVVAEEPAEVAISGIALPFGDRYLLRPGDYDLAVSAPGYHPFDQTIEVSREDSQRREIILQPLPGKLTLFSSPAAARVSIDGDFVGTTPLDELDVEAGEHTLLIEADRYKPLTQTIAITGRSVQQSLELSLDPAWAEVSINTQPSGAELQVDGEAVGTTPLIAEILEGDSELLLTLPGFAPDQLSLTVIAGEAQDLGIRTLIPASGALTLDSVPSKANVSVDGEFAGQTPLTVELSPDADHRISVSKAGYKRSSQTIRMKAGTQASRNIRLDALLGDVVVRVEPASAEILVNGKSVGTGSQTIALPAILQQLEFRLEGYESISRSVTPRAGLEQLIEVTLLSPEAARKARLTPTINTALNQTLVLMNPLDAPLNEFSMGASRRDPGRRANEVLHPVRLERPFYIQSREVTNAQFRLFEPTHNSGQVEGNSLNREKQPAVQVSWQQAASFCNWLSQREGLRPFYLEQQGIIVGFDSRSLGYRLPSEAEWAWVARVDGTEFRRFTWGEEFPPKTVVENVADNSSAYVTGRVLSGYNDKYVVSAPVGSYEANHRGLFDIGGNVSEWVHDVYTIPASSGAVQKDPLGAQRGDNYVLRGASWALGRLPELRLTYRDYGQAGRDDVGFRIARYAE